MAKQLYTLEQAKQLEDTSNCVLHEETFKKILWLLDDIAKDNNVKTSLQCKNTAKDMVYRLRALRKENNAVVQIISIIALKEINRRDVITSNNTLHMIEKDLRKSTAKNIIRDSFEVLYKEHEMNALLFYIGNLLDNILFIEE